ncbi:MAG: NADH-ubiquinone oxidoreductase-F iron-sulfur binding region domain-containing protein [Acidimicrobiia bacterium]|nr:NADH-ubiquinone oxidoreductase-F iron-sulfur binding region domain-containing protein [Acidimicrobiia bacterium]
MARSILLNDEPVDSVAAYAAAGGGGALAVLDRSGPAEVIRTIRDSGLRGRGGAGFPTGVKWSGLAAADADRKFVVCNAAEGEPGTFKDRWLMRTNPYQLLEGLVLAGLSVGAERAYIGIKEKFTPEIERLTAAIDEMDGAGLLGGVPIEVVLGPDDYLFGEEKGLLEVIEGRDPLPRLYPPYVTGLFSEGDDANPALVNNVETLSNVPHIVRNGADWFRSFGTEDTPGTMVFSVGGDVRREGVVELEMGTPLSFLLYVIGQGFEAGRRPKLITSGVSNRPLTLGDLDVPMDFGSLAAIGSGLGSGGFTAYDDTVCVAQVGAALSAFLYRGSCGQCPPCKLGSETITERFTRLTIGGGDIAAIEDIAAWVLRVTDSNRCGLGAGQQALARGILDGFPDDLAHHVGGDACHSDRTVAAPVIEDWEPAEGRFLYA